MLTYSFEAVKTKTLYEHLYNCIKSDILEGVLPPNTKLPSQRTFAKNFGVSTITVETAYSQLLAEGYIYSIAKKGFYIAKIEKKDNARCHTAIIKTESTIPYPTEREYYADFLSNQTNPDNFPFSVWAKLLREVIHDKKEQLMKNSPPGGISELRTAICNHLKEFRAIEATPEQIIIGAGTEYLYTLIIQLLGRDKIYALEDPGYNKIYKIYQSNGVNCCFTPLDKNGIEITPLTNQNVNVVHISPSHHYPTGRIMTVSRRYELLGWASEDPSRYVIEDDYDSEFRLSGNPIPSLQSIDISQRVIYINTFTKSLSSTIRISYMVLPTHLLKKFYDNLGFYSCTVSSFEQYTLSAFISQGYFEKHINRMRNYYRKKRDVIMNEIKNSPLSTISEICEESSGLHFLLKLHTSLNDSSIKEILKKNNINAAFISEYYMKATPKENNSLVINYSGIPDEKIKDALKILSNALKINNW